MLVLTTLPVHVFAAEAGEVVGSYTVGISKSTITAGGSASLTITAKKAAGQFTVTSSNPSVAKVGTSSVWVEDGYQTITVTAGSSGTVKVTATPTAGFSDLDGEPYNPGTKIVSVSISSNTGGSSGGGSTTPSVPSIPKSATFTERS